jgi:hypothetical protein
MRRVAPVVLSSVLLIVAGCERTKTKLDREVDRLCAIDGGVHIYETVKLPKENFGPDGEVFPKYRGLPFDRGRYGPEYYLRSEEKALRRESPSMYRFSVGIVRRSDGRVMGEQISYVRRGGDFPGPWADSVYGCNEKPGVQSIESMVFIQQGAKQ